MLLAANLSSFNTFFLKQQFAKKVNMLIQMLSVLSGNTHTRELDVTPEQIAEFRGDTRGRLIQQIFPALSADDREFLRTGITPEEWDAEFGSEEA